MKRLVRFLILLVCLSAAVIYSWFAIRSYRAYRDSQHVGSAYAARAVRLDPSNAAYHALLS